LVWWQNGFRDVMPSPQHGDPSIVPFLHNIYNRSFHRSRTPHHPIIQMRRDGEDIHAVTPGCSSA